MSHQVGKCPTFIAERLPPCRTSDTVFGRSPRTPCLTRYANVSLSDSFLDDLALLTQEPRRHKGHDAYSGNGETITMQTPRSLRFKLHVPTCPCISHFHRRTATAMSHFERRFWAKSSHGMSHLLQQCLCIGIVS